MPPQALFSASPFVVRVRAGVQDGGLCHIARTAVFTQEVERAVFVLVRGDSVGIEQGDAEQILDAR